MRRKPNRLFSMPENNIRSVKQNPFTPPATSPTELTTYIGTPPYICQNEWDNSRRGLNELSATQLFYRSSSRLWALIDWERVIFYGCSDIPNGSGSC